MRVYQHEQNHHKFRLTKTVFTSVINRCWFLSEFAFKLFNNHTYAFLMLNMSIASDCKQFQVLVEMYSLHVQERCQAYTTSTKS